MFYPGSPSFGPSVPIPDCQLSDDDYIPPFLIASDSEPDDASTSSSTGRPFSRGEPKLAKSNPSPFDVLPRQRSTVRPVVVKSPAVETSEVRPETRPPVRIHFAPKLKVESLERVDANVAEAGPKDPPRRKRIRRKKKDELPNVEVTPGNLKDEGEVEKDEGKKAEIVSISPNFDMTSERNNGTVQVAQESDANPAAITPSLNYAILDVEGSSSVEVGSIAGIDRTFVNGNIEFESRTRVARGGFCEIFIGHHATLGRVALKRPKEEKFEYLPEEKARQFEREIRVWETIKHKFVLPYFGLYEEGDSLYMVCPWIENGNMTEFIKNHRVDANRRQLLAQTAEGLAYLHEKKIIHKDLKAANVLVSDKGQALLSDFGLSKHTHESTTTAMKSIGTLRWESPEVLNEAPNNESSDVYAFAMTIVEVLTEDMPFSGKTDNQVMVTVLYHDRRPTQHPTVSPTGESWATIWQVASSCWAKDPGERLTAWEARERLQMLDT